MSGPGTVEDSQGARTRRRYERPAIVWREAYEPMAFGISCAKQPGNPPCNSGPLSG